MFIVGLTGGIGCGKTTVGHLFENLSVLVLDADEIGKELVQPGKPLLTDICNQFGPESLLADGTLNRSYLREIIFNDTAKKCALEAIMHPPILSIMQQRAAACDQPYCIFSIPLLFESKQDKYVDRILVVDIPPSLQIERVTQRSGLTAAEVQTIIDQQTSRSYRLAHADDVIDNSQNLNQLDQQVISLHTKFLALAHTHPKSPLDI